MKNVKILLLPVGIFFFLLTANAQPRAGIKAGLNYAGLSGYNGDQLLNVHAGVFLHVALDKNWRIQPEILYSGEGQHYQVYDNEHTVATKQTISLKYFQLPLLVQYFPLPSLYVEAGPQLGVLAGAYSKGIGSDHMNVKRSFGNTQFGMNLGMGVLIDPRIRLYGRYYFGLSDITPYNSDVNRSHTGQLGIAFLFIKKQDVIKTNNKPGSVKGTR